MNKINSLLLIFVLLFISSCSKEDKSFCFNFIGSNELFSNICMQITGDAAKMSKYCNKKAECHGITSNTSGYINICISRQKQLALYSTNYDTEMWRNLVNKCIVENSCSSFTECEKNTGLDNL